MSRQVHDRTPKCAPTSAFRLLCKGVPTGDPRRGCDSPPSGQNTGNRLVGSKVQTESESEGAQGSSEGP